MKKIAYIFTAAFMLLAVGCSQAVNAPMTTVNEPVSTEKPTVTQGENIFAEESTAVVNKPVSAEKSAATQGENLPAIESTAAVNDPAKYDDNSIVLPPVRIGKSPVDIHLAKEYTFETAFSTADAVARIKVGNWLSEDDEITSSFYEATVLQCFKGDIPETFILKQFGCSDNGLEGYPLFTYGNELLLFLGKGSSADYESNCPTKYEKFYWIIGSFSTVLDVSYDADGNRYFADRYGLLGRTIDVSSDYALQKRISSQVYSYTVKSDPFVANIVDEQHLYPYIFSESDIISLMM